MKNNEYNKVKVTNENVKNTPEFVGTPKVDSAAYVETVKPYKDELNSRRTNNDKIEEIGVNTKKKTAFTRNDYKKVQHGPTHLASTAGHTVVAATTISVTAIAVAVIGTTIIDEYVEELDPIVYLESNISTDSIDFRFTMPSNLLRYSNDVDPGTTEPEYYDLTNVKAMVYNDNYMDDQYVMEIGEYSEDPYNYIEAWMGFYNLSPNTNYTLCIYLENVRSYPDGKEEEVLGINNLSYRNFYTKPIPSNLITFTDISVETTEIHFQYQVHPSVLGVEVSDFYDPNHLAMFAELNGDDGYYDGFMVENVVASRETDYINCSGTFTGLSPNTTYTLKIMQSREQEYALLGQTRITTSDTIGHFTTPDIGPSSVTIGVIVPNEYVYEDAETPGDTPQFSKVYITISNDSFQDMIYVHDDVRVFDSEHVVGYVTFERLAPETSYTLKAETSDNNDTILLAETKVTTGVSETHFDGITCPYKVQTSMTTGDQAIMPIKLDFVDTGYVYGDSFSISIREPSGDVDIMSATLERTTDWQYAELTGTNISNYLGQELDVYINDANGNPHSYSSNVLIERATDNEIFDIDLLDLDSNNSITFSNNDRQFDYKAYYLYPNSVTADDMTIVFQDVNDSSYEFVFTLGGDSYPSATTLSKVLDQPYDMPTGVQIDTYQNIVSAYGGRTYNVYARYLPQAGTTQESKLLYEGVTFIFE